MQYNQFAQLAGPSLQRSITLRPPPLLSPVPSSKDLKTKQKPALKQLKLSKQFMKPVASNLQTKIFEVKTQTHDKNHRNVEQMIKLKLRVSQYATMPNNQYNHGLVSKIGSKKLHKKKDKIREITLTKQEDKSNSIKRFDKLLVNSEYDEFMNTNIEDKNKMNQNLGDTHINFSSSMEKSKEFDFNYNKFRSSSVVAFSHCTNQKRIKLVLKSSKRLTNDFKHTIRDDGTGNKSESKLDYTSNYDEHGACCHFKHCQENEQSVKQPDKSREKDKNYQFQIKKRILHKLNPRSQEKKTKNESETNMDIDCIDAWKNKEQPNQSHTHRLQEIETQENEIIEFVERQIHPS